MVDFRLLRMDSEHQQKAVIMRKQKTNDWFLRSNILPHVTFILRKKK